VFNSPPPGDSRSRLPIAAMAHAVQMRPSPTRGRCPRPVSRRRVHGHAERGVMNGPMPAEDRALVHALMWDGWYRDGYTARDASGSRLWRFRSGHCLEDPHRRTIHVRADSQHEAMQRMLRHLERAPAPATGSRAEPTAVLAAPWAGSGI
jgi:hypothetical protein